MCTYFDFNLDLRSVKTRPAELKFLSDSTDDPGIQKYFCASSGIGASSF